MTRTPTEQRDALHKTIRDLFPGDKNLRLREAIMFAHDSMAQLPYLSTSIMTALATASRYRTGPPHNPKARDARGHYLPNDFDDWTNYAYSEIHDALNWLLKIERGIIELGVELHRTIMARESARRAAEEQKDEKAYALKDAAQYGLYLDSLGGETTDASGGGRPISESGEGGGGGGGGGEGDGGGRGGATPEGGAAGELHSEGRPPVEGPAAKAGRILRG